MTTRFTDHLLGSDVAVHADRPAASAVPVGTLFACGEHDLIYKSDGVAWATWATLGSASPGGGSGEATWTAPTLQNGWVNFGSGYGDAGYRKDGSGVVHLRGTVKSGTVGMGTPIFTLPTGYRPTARAVYPIVCSNSAGNGIQMGEVDVYATGAVALLVGFNPYVFLDGITFYAD